MNARNIRKWMMLGQCRSTPPQELLSLFIELEKECERSLLAENQKKEDDEENVDRSSR